MNNKFVQIITFALALTGNIFATAREAAAPSSTTLAGMSGKSLMRALEFVRPQAAAAWMVASREIGSAIAPRIGGNRCGNHLFADNSYYDQYSNQYINKTFSGLCVLFAAAGTYFAVNAYYDTK